MVSTVENTMTSLNKRTNWWKTNGRVTNGRAVKREIRRVRSSKNTHVRDLIRQGKFTWIIMNSMIVQLC